MLHGLLFCKVLPWVPPVCSLQHAASEIPLAICPKICNVYYLLPLYQPENRPIQLNTQYTVHVSSSEIHVSIQNGRCLCKCPRCTIVTSLQLCQIRYGNHDFLNFAIAICSTFSSSLKQQTLCDLSRLMYSNRFILHVHCRLLCHGTHKDT